jgi:hypothetical protein
MLLKSLYLNVHCTRIREKVNFPTQRGLGLLSACTLRGEGWDVKGKETWVVSSDLKVGNFPFLKDISMHKKTAIN